MKRSYLATLWVLSVVVSMGIGMMIAPKRTEAQGTPRPLVWEYVPGRDIGGDEMYAMHRADVGGGWVVNNGNGLTFVPKSAWTR